MRILFIAVLSLFFIPLQSQGIIDKMAHLTCECMESTGYDNKTKDEVTQVMTNCLTEHLLANISALQDELNVEITDQVAMHSVGEKIGTRMATICPAAIIAIAGGSGGSEETGIPTNDGSSTSGKITSITGTEIMTISIENKVGEVENLLWLTSFEGDYHLLKLREAAIGKNVTFEYEKLEIYDPKEGEYILSKIIIGLKMNE